MLTPGFSDSLEGVRGQTLFPARLSAGHVGTERRRSVTTAVPARRNADHAISPSSTVLPSSDIGRMGHGRAAAQRGGQCHHARHNPFRLLLLISMFLAMVSGGARQHQDGGFVNQIRTNLLALLTQEHVRLHRLRLCAFTNFLAAASSNKDPLLWAASASSTPALTAEHDTHFHVTFRLFCCSPFAGCRSSCFPHLFHVGRVP